MAVSEKEAIASLKVLVVVAKADGVLHPEERKQLEESLAGAPLPGGATLQSLLDENHNLDAVLKEITSTEAREATYASAYALANADGDIAPSEKAVVDRVKTAFGLAEQQTGLVARVFNEAKDTVLPSNIKAVSDPVKRAKEIKEDTFKYAVFSGVLGAFPIPGLAIFTDLAAVALQVKLVRDIGLYYGHNMDKEAVKTLLAGIGVGTGARIAVSNLAKLLPGFGSAVGAASSFAATYAIGAIAVKYFDGGAKANPADLKKDFAAAQKEGKEQYKQNKSAIDAKQKENEAKIKGYSEDRKAGKITQEEYEKKVAELI